MVFRRGGGTPQYRPSNQESFVLPTRAALFFLRKKLKPFDLSLLPARGRRLFCRFHGCPQGASVSYIIG